MTKGPKVVMSYQRLLRGKNANMFCINFLVDNKLMCSIGMVKFHVGSFLGILVDFGEVKNLGEIGFVQLKLQANYDESET